MKALSFEEQCQIVQQGLQQDWTIGQICDETELPLKVVLDIFDRLQHEEENDVD